LQVLYLGDVGFCGGKKTRVTGKNPRSKVRTPNKLNPYMALGPGLNQGHIGGREALSPLHHPCSPKDIY